MKVADGGVQFRKDDEVLLDPALPGDCRPTPLLTRKVALTLWELRVTTLQTGGPKAWLGGDIVYACIESP